MDEIVPMRQMCVSGCHNSALFHLILDDLILSRHGLSYRGSRHLTVRARGTGVIFINSRLRDICSGRFYYNP
ncbi:unnamed protein product [Mycena citricolor]|uniref:Uncharacterized protein n=1 Tax=Mycena citricolor TaxID=2018698 RepID=A0AAD2H6C8_9AGAR|nr:unnamed protein product [Mycena citricolor]